MCQTLHINKKLSDVEIVVYFILLDKLMDQNCINEKQQSYQLPTITRFKYHRILSGSLA